MSRVFDLLRTARGKTTVVDSGPLRKMRLRLIELRKSSRSGVSGRGGKKYPVEYVLSEHEDTD